MKWSRSHLSWSEFERTLSGRAGHEDTGLTEHTGAAERTNITERTDAAEHTDRQDPPPPPIDPTEHVPYAELHVHSHYSFLDGASSPEALVAEATRLRLSGLAITDHDGFYGAARFAEAAEMQTRTDREQAEQNGEPVPPGLLTVYGAELSLGLDAPQLGVADPAGSHLLVLARGAEGYRRLAGAITEAQLSGGAKGRPIYDLEQLAEQSSGEWVILTGCRKGHVRRALDHASTRAEGEAAAARELDRLTALFGRDRVFVELTDHGHPGDDARCDRLAELARSARLPALVTGAVHYAHRGHASLAEAVAAVRARRSLDELDPFLPATGTAYLRSGRAMLRRFARHRDAIARTVPLARELAFPLRSARPDLPCIPLPEPHTQMSWLRRLVFTGMQERYEPHEHEHVRERLERELLVIEQKDFPGYFLIVHDIVQYARQRGILCQGRGSAANSAVCYALGITDVDSVFYDLPFERFLSSLRDEEPDIDVDFDSNRREEVIQYVYERYGRRGAAQVSNVISYRPKAALRDAAKALGYGPGQQRAWTRTVESWSSIGAAGSAERASGVPEPVLDLAKQLLKAPRHLGIHSGGMVLTRQPVGEVCPIEHARMENRTVLQWDKDDCAAMGLVKFDLLGLGMLHALSTMMDLISEATGESWTLATIPKEEAAVYDMLCRADAIGVFQLESRAQLNTLPRLRPRSFYDLVIEIALIRPGPMQGGAVHPYLRRRSGQEDVDYPHPLLIPVLKRTLGVPLFQEQLMQMATAVADCTPADADLLRRSMGSKRGKEKIDSLRKKMFAGMQENGIADDVAKGVYAQIEAFADFGFAESHSISFALLVYASSWFKLHYPAAFLAGLLRAQPMGFYAPRTLVEDAKRHGVEVRGPDVQFSGVQAGLEAMQEATQEATSTDRSPSPTGLPECADSKQPQVPEFDPDAPDDGARHRRDGAYAVRLGLAEIRGIEEGTAQRIVTAREVAPFSDLADLARRADLDRARIEALASAGALASLDLDRREALWSAGPAAENRERFLPGIAVEVQPPLLPVLTPAEQTALDLWSTGIVSGMHPVALLRGMLDARGIVRSDRILEAPVGSLIEVAGLVTHRQRPGTAGGVTFLTLEDESGSVNIVTWANIWQRYRLVARSSPALIIRGRLERTAEGVANVIADRFEPLPSPNGVSSRDFQ
ncbi:error-prone DNA polymerase [Leucobacter sp. GX24907]